MPADQRRHDGLRTLGLRRRPALTLGGAIDHGSSGSVAADERCNLGPREGARQAPRRDRYELAAAKPTALEDLSPLLLWLTSNTNNQCWVLTDAGTHEHTVALESWWLAKVLAATPLDATAAWIEAREVPTPADYQREKAEEIYVPGPSEPVEPSAVIFGSRHLAESFAVRRAARALTDALVIRWLRESDAAAPPALLALDARVGSSYREQDGSLLGDHLAQPGKRAVVQRLDEDDELSRGQALGLPGPVRYTHD